jgi:hypothetical protein
LRGFSRPRDAAAAHAWLALAVELGRGEAQQALAELDAGLSAEERSRAAALAAAIGR